MQCFFIIRNKIVIQTLLCISAVVLLIVIVLGEIDAPIFSEISGFYEESFYLNIDSERGTNVYYTLDGSIPTEDSYIYTDPILIENATTHENTYSMRTDTSTGFRTDLIEYYEAMDAAPGYIAPDYLVDKCTVVRAIAVNKSGVKSEVSTGTFFVGIQPEDYDGCNIISVVTDPSNLFDAEKGIYVTGNIFDNYLKKGKMDKYWRFWSANYRESGREWEREATFQIFNERGEFVLSKDGGIRTRGNVSKGTLPRGLNLYSRDEYDGKETFGTLLFNGEYAPQDISLMSGGNELTTQFNDYMMTECTGNLNFATMMFEPYVLFLDGEYWGFYWLTEKYDEKYIEYHYNVDANQVIMIKNDELEVGNERDALLYQEMKEFISNNDMSLLSNYERACDLIDIDSFLDYYATMIYIARSEDWPTDNFALWRTKESKGQAYSDGKWRWMLFDCNSTSMSDDEGLVPHDTLSYVIENDELFASLWRNNLFQELFRIRILNIADDCFAAEDMDCFIEDYNTKMVPILSKSWARFYGCENSKSKEYYDRMESYRIFFENRKEVVEEWFE